MSSFDQLGPSHRRALFQNLCALVWADGEVSRHEVTAVTDLLMSLDVTAKELEEVGAWLENPPHRVPGISDEHWDLFMNALRDIAAADGVDEKELTWLRRKRDFDGR